MDIDEDSERAKRRKWLLLLMMYRIQRKKKRVKRTIWVKQWLAAREQQSSYYNILQELRVQDAENYRKYLRMNVETFTYLLEKVRPQITLRVTNLRKPISAEEQLAVTLRFMATGESFGSLMFQYRMSKQSIRRIIPRVSLAIVESLMDIWMPFPKGPADWQKIADEFLKQWNFPNCIGALDGKHIAINQPWHSVANYRNYKGFFSVILMALVDADYRFIHVTVGAQGRLGDASVFKDGELCHKLSTNKMKFPVDKRLPNDAHGEKFPYMILADDAFPLKRNIMKPYNRRGLSEGELLFNYRLSRGRRAVENAFGIMAQVFRVFFTTMNLEPELAKLVTLACCVLHNLLRTLSKDTYTPTSFIDHITTRGLVEGSWRDEPQSSVMYPLKPDTEKTDAYEAHEIRDYLKEYFQGNGSVSWQYQHVYHN